MEKGFWVDAGSPSSIDFLIKKNGKIRKACALSFVNLLVLATASCTKGESNVLQYLLV